MAYKSFYRLTITTNPGKAREFFRLVHNREDVVVHKRGVANDQTLLYIMHATSKEDALAQFDRISRHCKRMLPATVSFCLLDYDLTLEIRREDLSKAQRKVDTLQTMIDELEQEQQAELEAKAVKA